MNFIDTDLWHKREPGEITGSATGRAGPLMNLKSMSYLPVLSGVYERRFGERCRGARGCPLFTFQLGNNFFISY